jgi:hypothetical protein
MDELDSACLKEYSMDNLSSLRTFYSKRKVKEKKKNVKFGEV